MLSSEKRFIRIAGLCGIALPIITLTTVFVSIALSPWFNWQRYDLSDLGASPTPNPFNAGLVAGGLLSLAFAIGVGRWMNSGKLSRSGSITLSIGSIALASIGVFTQNVGRVHTYIAATYFLLTPVSYMLLGTAMLKQARRVPGVLSIAAGIAALLPLLFRATIVYHGGIAVPEILAAMITSSWTFSMGVSMLAAPTNKSI